MGESSERETKPRGYSKSPTTQEKRRRKYGARENDKGRMMKRKRRVCNAKENRLPSPLWERSATMSPTMRIRKEISETPVYQAKRSTNHNCTQPCGSTSDAKLGGLSEGIYDVKGALDSQ